MTSSVKIEFCHCATFSLRATFSILIKNPTIPLGAKIKLHIFNLHVFNSPEYGAYLMIDSERLGASATDGVWLRARVRNGRVGLMDEKVNVKSKYPTVSTIAHHSARAGCAAPR